MQRALFFEILNHKLDTIPESEVVTFVCLLFSQMKFYMDFLQDIMDDKFLSSSVLDFLSFFARYEEEDKQSQGTAESGRQNHIPFSVCNMLTTLPTTKGSKEVRRAIPVLPSHSFLTPMPSPASSRNSPSSRPSARPSRTPVCCWTSW